MSARRCPTRRSSTRMSNLDHFPHGHPSLLQRPVAVLFPSLPSGSMSTVLHNESTRTSCKIAEPVRASWTLREGPSATCDRRRSRRNRRRRRRKWPGRLAAAWDAPRRRGRCWRLEECRHQLRHRCPRSLATGNTGNPTCAEGQVGPSPQQLVATAMCRRTKTKTLTNPQRRSRCLQSPSLPSCCKARLAQRRRCQRTVLKHPGR